jgi:hypothetical protein
MQSRRGVNARGDGNEPGAGFPIDAPILKSYAVELG